jgi:MFS family permease
MGQWGAALDNKLKVSFIYIASTISIFGDLLTSLGLQIFLYQSYGSSSVAGSFIVSILPQLWLVKFLTHRCKQYSLFRSLITLRILGACCVALLVWFHDISEIYVFLFFSSLIMGISLNIQRSLVSYLVPKNHLKTVHRRLTSLRAIAIMLAPACGGFLLQKTNYQVLFSLDAVTFLISAVLYMFLQNKSGAKEKYSNSASETQDNHLKQILHPVIFIWGLFLLLGAFHNGTQVPVLKLEGLDPYQIGLILMFWGLGGTIALIFPSALAKYIYLLPAVLIFVLTLTFYLFGLSFVGSGIAMLICGFLYSFIIGELRAKISSLAEGKEATLSIWSSVSQISAWIQLFGFIWMAVMQRWYKPTFAGWSVLISGTILALSIIFDMNRKNITSKPSQPMTES